MNDQVPISIGGYPIERLLDKGAYSLTFRATSAAAPLAIKLLRDDLRDPALSGAIVKGWEAARAVMHPNLVVIYSATTDAALGAYALEELVEGKTLRALALSETRISWRDSLVLAEQLFQALGALHAAGLCHGDVWPGNVFITQDQDLKLEGAGGLNFIDRPAPEIIHGPALGYVAPERLQGTPATPESDLYSAGACLYFMLAGCDPFAGEGHALIQTACDKMPPKLSAAQPDLPAAFDEFIARLMAKNPAERYGTVAAVLADFAALKAGQPLAPLQPGRPAPPRLAGRSPGAPPPLKPALAEHRVESSAPAGAPLLPVVPKVSGVRKVLSGLTVVGMHKGGTQVFGRLDTQVKSTIPKNEQERRGDVYYQQGQLPLALSAWREAYEREPHTALKAKIEMGVMQMKKESYESALEGARNALAAREFRAAMMSAREAIDSAENEAERNAATQVQQQAAQGAQQARSAATAKTLLYTFVALCLLGGVVWWQHSTGSAPESQSEPGLAPIGGQPASVPLPSAPARVSVANTGATIIPPQDWTVTANANGKFEMRTQSNVNPGEPDVGMSVDTAPPGMVFTSAWNDLRSRHGLPDATEVASSNMFRMIDNAYQCGELGISYNPKEGGQRQHYYYLLVAPVTQTLYIVQFDGAAQTFNGQRVEQMRAIMRSWTYQK